MSESANYSNPESRPPAHAVVRRRITPQAFREEPFRIFFPLGLFFGISGVSLWPLWFSGLHKFYPGVMHARIMIEGFLGAFVLGFLSTAVPRLTGTRNLSWTELGCFIFLAIGTIGLHIAHQHTLGDAAFLALLLLFVGCMGSRLSQSTDRPPPTFTLVAFGIVNAVAGTCLLLSAPLGVQDIRSPALGLLMLEQGFVLSLVLGIGGFLVPRFLGLPRSLPPEATPEFSQVWNRRALRAAAIGTVLLATFVMEVFTSVPKLAGAIRLVAVAVFLGSEIPLRGGLGAGTTVSASLRLALLFLLLGILFPILWPVQRVAGLHLLFIGGFTLITFTVATRVVLGHSGQAHLAMRPFAPLSIAAGLLILAAILRIVGDFQLLTRGHWLDAASYAWMVAAGVWGFRVLPNVRFPDEEDSP